MAVGAQGGGGLGMLAALGGGGQDPNQGTAPSADDLLAQIKDLLQQYLALGPDTPVAAQAQALSDAIDAQGNGEPEGSPAEEADETPAQEKAEIAGGEAPDADDVKGKYSGGDGFKRARPGAKAFLKSKNKKAKA